MTRADTDWRALARAIEGDVVLPGAPDYEAARRPAIARFDAIRPAAVVRCASAADVAEALAFSRRTGLPFAARSGGHCFAGRSSTDGVVIDVSPMRSVAVADHGVATIGAGARLAHVYDALHARGLTIPAGCGPTVGIAGLVLGGGLGILGRTHGLTSDSLLGARVVLADGAIVECDERKDADLFWALRGAGAGGFGIVASLRFDTRPPPAGATRFHLAWSHAAAANVIDAWQRLAPDAPDALSASVLVSAPADPAEPPGVAVSGAMLGGEADAARLLGELAERAGAPPTSRVLAHATYRETKRALSELGDSSEAGHPYNRSEFFARTLPAEAIAALVEHLVRDRVAGQARELDFTPWGGAYNRVAEDATAFAHRGERFLLKHAVVVAPDASGVERAAARGWLDRSWGLVRPYGSGRVYPNFPDPGLDDPGRAYYGANHERLTRIKARYDPEDVFGGPQSIPRAPSAAPPIG
jgi:FAD/FMN-containing dehydrogenase